MRIPGVGELSVAYTGVSFEITGVAGDVYVNNRDAVPGMELHEACVLTFGKPERKSQRSWVTFSSSHPEVIL
ncbi:hypothetical protein D3C78_1835180 [compost metagenome]